MTTSDKDGKDPSKKKSLKSESKGKNPKPKDEKTVKGNPPAKVRDTKKGYSDSPVIGFFRCKNPFCKCLKKIHPLTAKKKP